MPVPKKKRPLVLSVRPAAAASAAAAPGAPPQPKRKRSKPAQPHREHTQHPQQHPQQPRGRARPSSASRAPPAHSPAAWTCASVIDQQSAEALARLLDAAATRSHGASIKSLTLAPHVVHKKPTFAVTCETLKHLPLLQAVLAATGLLQQHEPQVRLGAGSRHVASGHCPHQQPHPPPPLSLRESWCS
jgi:putative methyltransferase